MLVVLLGLIFLAAGVNVAFWFCQPALEPLPSVATEQLEARVRELLDGAAANVAMDNRSAAAWGDLGAACFAHNFEPQAQVCFRNAERLAPGDYRWPYLLGVSLIYTDGDQMLAAYRRAAERCGERAHVQLRLVETLLERGELEEADGYIQLVLAHSPSHSRAQFAQARLLLARGKLVEAKSWAERSAAGAADKRAPHLLLAHLCRRTNDLPGEAKAVAALEQIPDGFSSWDDPDVADVLDLSQDRATRLARAEKLAESGETAAKETLSELMEGADGSSAAARLARAFNREGKSGQAEALLRHQLPGSPNDERLHFQLGVACFQLGNYPDAAAEFRRVVELKPDFVDAWYNLGLALLKLDRPSDARVAFAATVRLRPSRFLARIKLAELLLADGKREEAKEHLEAALKLAPEERQARELLARIKAGGKL
jgi:tetratricopeptide (TPR) repeat protein